MEQHLSCSEWTRLLSDRDGFDVDAAAAHLAQCGPCWNEAARAADALTRRGVSLRFEDARAAVIGIIEAVNRTALRWLLARAAWAELSGLDADQQIKRLRADKALQSRQMFDTVLAEASAVAHDDPCLGEERAEIANALADLLPEDKAVREDLQASAILGIANSRRLAANWSGSASAIKAADRHRAAGTGDPVLEARLLSIQASLASDTGHLDPALDLLTRAAEIGRRLSAPSILAALEVQEASVNLAAIRYEEAIARAEQALGLLAPGEIRLEMLARGIVVESLIFLGRPAEALPCYAASLPLFENLTGRRSDLRRGYLEALLLDSLGSPREAEKAFRVNIAACMTAERYKEAFCTMLTFFEALVQRGLLKKAERACEEALAMTRQAGSACHGQMIELWQGLLTLLQAGRLVKEHVLGARAYLVRSWHAPSAQGPLRQPVRVVLAGPPAGRQHRAQPHPGPPAPPAVVPPPETAASRDGYQERLERQDRTLIAQALAQCGGSLRKAALLVGLARGTLAAKLKRYGLQASGPDGDPVLAGTVQEDSSLPPELRAVLDGMRARACWQEMAAFTAQQQVRRLETVEALRTPEMLAAVMAAARSAAVDDPALGEQRALVACTLAGLLPASCCSQRRRAELQLEARLLAANCRQRAGDPAGSAAALEAARRQLGPEADEGAHAVELLSIEASLAADTGRVKEALDLLARAAALCRRTGGASPAWIAVQEANTLLIAFRYEEAVTRAEAAIRRLAPPAPLPQDDARLELLARAILTESLALLGRGDEALRSLYTSLPLFQRLRGRRTELQLGYLESLVLDSLGRHREAKGSFRANIAAWMEAGQFKDALLIQLTWFERLHRRGEIQAAVQTGREALRQFETLEPKRHARVLDLWRNLLDRVETRELTDPGIREARVFAMAAFARPAALPDAKPAAPPREEPRRFLRLAAVLPILPEGPLVPGSYRRLREEYDRLLLAAALEECRGWSRREICRRLGISVPTLTAKLRKYGLER